MWTPELLPPTDEGCTLTLRSLCLLYCASDAFAFLSSGRQFASGCWRACWEELVCCPKTGAAGSTTQTVPIPNSNSPQRKYASHRLSPNWECASSLLKRELVRGFIVDFLT